MKKILTISEPNCGGKPTGYAVPIPNDNFKTLETEVLKGLVKGWHFTEGMARAVVIDEDIDALKEQGYTYLQDRFIVEVTIIDEVEADKPERSTKVLVFPFTKFKVEADVDWDVEEGETAPDRKFEVTFTPEELTSWGVLDKGDGEKSKKWFINEVMLELAISDYLTDFTDFLHKGFTFKWDYER